MHLGRIFKLAGGLGDACTAGNSGPLAACFNFGGILGVTILPGTLTLFIAEPGRIWIANNTGTVAVPFLNVDPTEGNFSLASGAAYSVAPGQAGALKAVAAGDGVVYFASGRQLWAATADGASATAITGRNSTRSIEIDAGGLAVTLSAFVDVGALAASSDGGLFVGAVVALDSAELLFARPRSASFQLMAGRLPPSSCGDGGPVTAACVSIPVSVATDANGSIAFADTAAGTVRAISSRTGVVSTVAGAASCSALGHGNLAKDMCFTDLTGALALSLSTGTIAFASQSEGIVMASAATERAEVLVNASDFSGGLYVAVLAFNMGEDTLFFADALTATVHAANASSGVSAILVDSDPRMMFGSQVGLAICRDSLLIAASGGNVILALDLSSTAEEELAVFAGNASCDSSDPPNDGSNATSACLLYPTALAVDAASGDVAFTDRAATVIRAVDGGTGIISTVFPIAGSSNTPTCFWGGIAFDAAANLIVSCVDSSSSGASGIYIMLTASNRVACPAGYACPSGRPVPCTDSATFCPGNTLAPILPAARYAPSDAILTASGVMAFTAQVVCPVGSFCVAGVLHNCPPGTLGQFLGAHSASSGCAACGRGTYSPLSGLAATRCLPCPLGSSPPVYAAASEAAGASQCSWCSGSSTSLGAGEPCVACLPGSYSMGGPTQCVPLPGAMVFFAWGLFSSLAVKNAPSGGSGTSAISGLISSASDVQATLLTPSASDSDPVAIAAVVLVAFAGALLVATLLRAPLTFLRQIDAFRWEVIESFACIPFPHSASRLSLRHPTVEGSSPIKKRTAFGGACALLAYAAILAVGTLLVSTYLNFKSVASLPVYSPVTASYVALPVGAAAPTDVTVSGVASMPSLATGLRFAVFAHGPRCGAPAAWNASNLLSGGNSFSYAKTFDEDTGSAAHVFDCPACAPLPVSLLDVRIDASCEVRPHCHVVMRKAYVEVDVNTTFAGLPASQGRV